MITIDGTVESPHPALLPLVSILGIVLLTVTLHLSRGIGYLHGQLAKSLLVRAPRTADETCRRLNLAPRAAAAACCALLVAGCGHADTDQRQRPLRRSRRQTHLLRARAAKGFLRARLQGAIDAEIDWSAPAVAQCLGGPRPGGDGLRLVYKGTVDAAPAADRDRRRQPPARHVGAQRARPT